MITYKKSTSIQMSGVKTECMDYRSAAFGFYRNLLAEFDSKNMVLMESLGHRSHDSKVSMVGIDPVLNIKVFNCTVTIIGNNELINSIRLLYGNEHLIASSAQTLQYQLVERKSVWDFLRLLDSQFQGIKDGVLAFVTFSYNTVYFIEEISGYVEGAMPDISLVCYSTYIECTHDEVTLHEYGFVGAASIGVSRIEPYLSYVDVKSNPLISPLSNHSENDDFFVQRETSREGYLQKAGSALKHVQIGDVYQIQIGQKLEVTSKISALDVYARLRLMNPSPYMYLLDCGEYRVIGASPESFIYINKEQLVMRPIAGTLGKSTVGSKDDAIVEFHSNSKEIAEHMMLVDLCRNDLSRISLPQSLEVSELMSVEEYSHVYHMVSTVKSQLKRDCDKFDALQASFPAGTMTGTPKIRAIELISEIEDSDRGLYAGALGVMTLGANFINTALCIRSTVECDGVFTLRASAGIVADSVIENEYLETLHKMGSVFKAITNEEISCHIM